MTLPNIIEIQEELKNQPDNILMREMQMPTGNMPQFLVLGELKRRKSMRDDYQRRQNSDMKTVAEEVVTGAGVPQEGIMGVAKNMAPKTNVAQNTGIAQATPVTPTQAPQPQMMADGGIMRLANGGMSGGTISAIAVLKENYPELYEQYKDGDPKALEELAKAALQDRGAVAKDPDMTGLEELAAPRSNDLIKRMFSDPTRGDIKDQQKKDATEFGEEYAIQSQIDSATKLRNMSEDDPTFSEGSLVEMLKGTPEGGLPTAKGTIDATGIEGLMLPPPRSSDAPRPTASIDPFRSYDLNLDGTTSLPDAPAMPSVGGIGDIIRQNEMRRMQGLDPVEDGYTPLEEAKRKLLADERNVGFVDDADISNERDAEYRTRYVTPEVYADRDRAYRFLEQDPIGEIISDKALDYYKLANSKGRGLTTPREEVYSTLLGGSNSGLALSGVEQSELDRIADAQYKDKMANEVAKQQGFFADQDAQADKKFFDVEGGNETARFMSDDPAGIGGVPYTPVSEINEPISAFLGRFNRKKITEGGNETATLMSEDLAGIGGDIFTDFPKPEVEAATDAEKTLQKRLDNPIPNPTTPSVVGGASSATAQEAAAQKNFSTDKWMALAMIGAGLSSGRPDDVGKSVKSGIEYLQKSKQGKMAYDAKMKQIDATLQASLGRAGQGQDRLNIARAKIFQDQAADLRSSLLLIPKEDQQSETYINAVNRIAELDETVRRLMGGDVVVKKGRVLSDGPERNKVG